ncbi:MAG: hypothetical protein Q8K92_02650, partial [Leadbetterella sp.]|nr:hypothetical protein [Leadbetterella sp.]
MKTFGKTRQWLHTVFLLTIFTQHLTWSQNNRREFPYFYDINALDINTIYYPNSNYGFLAVSNQSGIPVVWSHYDSQTIVFEQGLFFIGKIVDSVYLSEAMWGSLYSPGPIFNNKPAMAAYPADSAKYRVYKITKGDSVHINLDLKEWPKQFGAPISGRAKVKLYGDQMLWTVYNGYDSNSVIPTGRGRSKYPPFPIEIQQNIFAYKNGTDFPVEFLDDVVFLEYTIINKGSYPIDSAYVGLWTDIDFYGENNYPAIDTTLQLGYCWSDYHSNISWYDSSKIPAIGYIQLFGPTVYSSGSIATFKGENRNNHKNLNLTSFWGFHDDSYPDPSDWSPAYSRTTAWNIARGYDKSGENIIDPTTGNKTSFRYAGDPITNNGWLANVHPTSGGAGFYLFSGPFSLASQDTQWVMYALIAAKGEDNLKSIVELRRRAGELKKLDYTNLVKITEIVVEDTTKSLVPSYFLLEQNYPNPFN